MAVLSADLKIVDPGSVAGMTEGDALP
jgi:hypothetical protein